MRMTKAWKRWGGLALGLVACAVDDRSVGVQSEQPIDLGACTPGALPSRCEGGLMRVCTAEARWVLAACDSGVSSMADGTATASVGTVSSAGAGGAPAAPLEAAAEAGAGGSSASAPSDRPVAAGGGPSGSGGSSAELLPAGGGGGAMTGELGAAGSAAEVEVTLPTDFTQPFEVVIPPGDCRFEYLGQWVRCENAGYPNTLETSAPDVVSCMRLCLERDDCTGVTDYLWLGMPDLGCFLYFSTCGAPAVPVWGEEDGGRDFRRVCSSAAP